MPKRIHEAEPRNIGTFFTFWFCPLVYNCAIFHSALCRRNTKENKSPRGEGGKAQEEDVWGDEAFKIFHNFFTFKVEMPYRIFAEGCRLSLWNPLTNSLLYITPRYCCQLRHIIYHAGHSTINGEEEDRAEKRKRMSKRTQSSCAVKQPNTCWNCREELHRPERGWIILWGVNPYRAEASLLLGSVNNAHGRT